MYSSSISSSKVALTRFFLHLFFVFHNGSGLGGETDMVATQEGASQPITLCFGKPICAECYEDDECDLFSTISDGDPQDEWSTFLPWISCTCHKSFFCRDCHEEAKAVNQELCNFCDGKRYSPGSTRDCPIPPSQLSPTQLPTPIEDVSD